MDSIRTRAADQFPTVLITLLSIIQALALEFLWDHIHHRPGLRWRVGCRSPQPLMD